MDCVTNKAPIFPVEIMYHILLFASPEQLIHLQRVSKQFYAILNDPIFLGTLYAGAPLTRPPGPFSWQSAKFLQRTLARSAQLAQKWTSQPMKVFSQYSLTLASDDDFEFVCGRWWIVCAGMRQLVSYDIDTGAEQMLYQSDYQWISWSATCCKMSDRGLLLYVGLFPDRHGSPGNSIKLLEFQIDGDSGYLSGPITFDTPIVFPEDDASIVLPSVVAPLRLTSGDMPFVFISLHPSKSCIAHALVFDTRSQIFYKFPEPSPGPDTGRPRHCSHHRVIVLTTTHIITSSRGLPTELVQAYVIPDGDETHELRVSHETNAEITGGSWSLLRNSVVDCITGSTSMRLLQNIRSAFHQQFWCVDITLPTNSTENVLPMSINVHLASEEADFKHEIAIQSSHDGFARGLSVVFKNSRDMGIRRFTLDATGERCVVAAGGTLLLPFQASNFPGEWELRSFDGTRGRLHYTSVKGTTLTTLTFGPDFE